MKIRMKPNKYCQGFAVYLDGVLLFEVTSTSGSQVFGFFYSRDGEDTIGAYDGSIDKTEGNVPWEKEWT